jgi:hypothetical protein
MNLTSERALELADDIDCVNLVIFSEAVGNAPDRLISEEISAFLRECAKLMPELAAANLTISNAIAAFGDSYDVDKTLGENVMALRENPTSGGSGWLVMSIAQHALDRGAKYPYDASDAWRQQIDPEPIPAKDWAHAAARGVLADLFDRRDIKCVLKSIDEDTRAEMVELLAEIIRLAATEKPAGAGE